MFCTSQLDHSCVTGHNERMLERVLLAKNISVASCERSSLLRVDPRTCRCHIWRPGWPWHWELTHQLPIFELIMSNILCWLYLCTAECLCTSVRRPVLFGCPYHADMFSIRFAVDESCVQFLNIYTTIMQCVMFCCFLSLSATNRYWHGTVSMQRNQCPRGWASTSGL